MFAIYQFSLGTDYSQFFALEVTENLIVPHFREEGYKREQLLS